MGTYDRGGYREIAMGGQKESTEGERTREKPIPDGSIGGELRARGPARNRRPRNLAVFPGDCRHLQTSETSMPRCLGSREPHGRDSKRDRGIPASRVGPLFRLHASEE